jgi:hypothetical protein
MMWLDLNSLELSFAWFNECRDIHPDIVDAMSKRIGRFPVQKMVAPHGMGCGRILTHRRWILGGITRWKDSTLKMAYLRTITAGQFINNRRGVAHRQKTLRTCPTNTTIPKTIRRVHTGIHRRGVRTVFGWYAGV